MNLSRLQKHYDKLTPPERFAAFMAAAMRKDKAEQDALLNSAPHKIFSLPDVRGMAEGFDFLVMWHVLNQLGHIANFYYLILMDDTEDGEDFSKKAINFTGYTVDELITYLQQEILTGREAWRAICKEYGLDPDYMLGGLPFIDMLQLSELLILAANREKPLGMPNLEKSINGFRKMIEDKRKQWE